MPRIFIKMFCVKNIFMVRRYFENVTKHWDNLEKITRGWGIIFLSPFVQHYRPMIPPTEGG